VDSDRGRCAQPKNLQSPSSWSFRVRPISRADLAGKWERDSRFPFRPESGKGGSDSDPSFPPVSRFRPNTQVMEAGSRLAGRTEVNGFVSGPARQRERPAGSGFEAAPAGH
jgi:hypothetical protein